MKTKNKKTTYIINGFITLFIYICIIFLMTFSASATPELPGTDLINTKFKLINQNKERVTEKDYLGKYQIIFFGFTSCPVICPTALGKIDEALTHLGDLQEQITPIFITVDPERDTPVRLKEFLPRFKNKFIGLTGTEAEIESASQSFRAYFHKIILDNDYTFDHSSIIYFMSPKGEYIKHFPFDSSPNDISNFIKEYLLKNNQ